MSPACSRSVSYAASNRYSISHRLCRSRAVAQSVTQSIFCGTICGTEYFLGEDAPSDIGSCVEDCAGATRAAGAYYWGKISDTSCCVPSASLPGSRLPPCRTVCFLGNLCFLSADQIEPFRSKWLFYIFFDLRVFNKE